MKRKKLNFDVFNTSLNRYELREITAGLSCSGNWTIHPACNPYDGSSPNAIICYDGPSDLLVCNPAPGTNPQTACCG